MTSATFLPSTLAMASPWITNDRNSAAIQSSRAFMGQLSVADGVSVECRRSRPSSTEHASEHRPPSQGSQPPRGREPLRLLLGERSEQCYSSRLSIRLHRLATTC